MTDITETDEEYGMDPTCLRIGDTVEDSPVGPGTITGITQAGFPQVDRVAVARLVRTDGLVFDPYGSYEKEKKIAASAKTNF